MVSNRYDMRIRKLCLAMSYVMVLAGTLTTHCAAVKAEGRQLTALPTQPDMPPLGLENLQGQYIDIGQLRQSVVIVNFWASWCPSCIRELHAMHQAAAALAQQDVVILAVNVGDNINTIQHFFADFVPAYEVLADEASSTAHDWQIQGLPTTYVIGADRKIHYGVIGVLAWESARVRKTIVDLRTAGH